MLRILSCLSLQGHQAKKNKGTPSEKQRKENVENKASCLVFALYVFPPNLSKTIHFNHTSELLKPYIFYFASKITDDDKHSKIQNMDSVRGENGNNRETNRCFAVATINYILRLHFMGRPCFYPTPQCGTGCN